MDNKQKAKLPRCPKGSRRNPKTKRCNKIKETKSTTTTRKRCPNGAHKNPKTGECDFEPYTPDEPVQVVSVSPPLMLATLPPLPSLPPLPEVTQKELSILSLPTLKLTPTKSTRKRCPNGTRKNKKTGECEAKAQPSTTKAQPSTTKAQPSTTKAQPSTTKAQPSTTKEPSIVHIRSPESEISKQVERLIMSGVPSYSPEVNKYIVGSLMRETPTDQVKYVSDCVTAKDFNQKIEGYPMIFVPKMYTCLLQNDISGLAKKALIEDLGVTTAKHIDPSKIIAPKQLHANCWFNTFFMCFFVSDKGRKFFRFFRELMITGERIIMNENGKTVRKKINKPTVLKALAWLNLGISASINGDPKAIVLDTNKIIERLSTAGIGYTKVKKYGNPIRAYTKLTNFLYPSDSSSARTSLNFVRIDQDFKGLSFEDNIKNERRFIKIKKIPDVLFVELYGKQPNSGKLIKKTEFILPETDIKYVLDSVVVRDLAATHFCCLVTINGEEWGFDGASFKKLGRFEWKKLINTNTQWTFDDLTDKKPKFLPAYFSFNPTDKMLKKHKPTKKGEYNTPHTIYFYYRQN
jgi:hypothetical protein